MHSATKKYAVLCGFVLFVCFAEGHARADEESLPGFVFIFSHFSFFFCFFAFFFILWMEKEVIEKNRFLML